MAPWADVSTGLGSDASVSVIEPDAPVGSSVPSPWMHLALLQILPLQQYASTPRRLGHSTSPLYAFMLDVFAIQYKAQKRIGGPGIPRTVTRLDVFRCSVAPASQL